MNILFLCTAHNSLSQRLSLDLNASGHDVSVEYALSDEAMEEAVVLSRPDLVICPFLTTRVPKNIYNKVLTLIIHPGPPGDAGPSAIDWVLMGDDGSIEDAAVALQQLDCYASKPGRSHWGVTVLEAIEDFDAGPVWAFEQFPIDIDQAGMTKSELYRGPVTQAAITATRAAVSRVDHIARGRRLSIDRQDVLPYSPKLRPDLAYSTLSVTHNNSFLGGKTHHRPLLKAAQREIDLAKHSAKQLSRRIRCADSQPGVLSKVFGQSLYIYGGIIDDNLSGRRPTNLPGTSARVLGIRDEAICIATCDGKGIWINYIRRPKGSKPALWPKVPATIGLMELGILSTSQIMKLHWPSTCDWSPSSWSTYQEIWIDFDYDENDNKTAFLYFDFYNGATSTDQCSRLIDAMDYILSESTNDSPVKAVTFMGGSYFSNGIALNVIEAAPDPAQESWLNINRINDVVHFILYEFPSRGILTFAAMRGNAAAGGVAMAAACDIVIAGSGIVLNPAYRGIGLFGSEYHTLSYYGRCGEFNGRNIVRDMVPISPLQAQRIGLVDYVFPGTGDELIEYIRTHIAMLLKPACLTRGFWKTSKVDLSPASLARARATELSEMSKDFWSARSSRYHSRRFDFVRKVKPAQTPLRFAKHRCLYDTFCHDIEETDEFDDVEYYRKSAEETLLARLRDQMCDETATTTPIVKPPTPTFEDKTTPTAVARKEHLFSCYYQPKEDLLTPPETPLETPLNTEMTVSGSFFRKFEAPMNFVD